MGAWVLINAGWYYSQFRTLPFEARGQAFRVISPSVINSETPIVFITMALDR
jgi:hypothetical protein